MRLGTEVYLDQASDHCPRSDLGQLSSRAFAPASDPQGAQNVLSGGGGEWGGILLFTSTPSSW